jgi:uncharacterized protein YndB with AHSA1/START domain
MARVTHFEIYVDDPEAARPFYEDVSGWEVSRFVRPMGRRSMRQWYFDLKEFKPKKGFEFEFTFEHKGMKYCHVCKITEVIPQKKIAYSWRYERHEGNSLVTFELFAEGDKTRLKLTHEGLETFPKLPSFARENFLTGWTQIIGSSLKEFLEKNAVGSA